jgi:hypothetical protein
MAIVLTCECGRRLQVQDEYAGQEGQCPGCGCSFLIPELTAGPSVETFAAATERLVDLRDTVARHELDAPPAQAPASIPDHGGEPLLPDLDFFAAPPSDIGPVLSMHSTLRQGVEPWSPGGRVALSALFAAIGGLVAYFIVAAVDPSSAIWYAVWPLATAALGFLTGLGTTGFKHVCSYVGKDGVARFICTGDRTNISTAELFCFRDAAELRTAQTRRYVNGGYQGTSYSFTWTDVGGRTRYSYTGTHHSEKTSPPSTDAFQFGRAAELAWTDYLGQSAFRQLELSGSVSFSVSGGRVLRIGKGFVVVCEGGQEDRWDAQNIDGVLVEQGVMRIRRRGATEGWFSSQGVFKFELSSLANAQLFLNLLEYVAGLPIH